MHAPASSSTALAPGYFLDRYELLTPVAEGGFGQVWLARLRGKRGFEKLVAIKVPKLSGDVHFQEMLLDEARIASAINHDNVAKILELGEQDDVLYIVMEWIDGDALSTLLRALDKKKIPIPLPLALRIALDMCAAAHAAHELRRPDGTALGVVHRDISPQNILITVSGGVKLIDFGIAKARDRASGETTDGTLKGKVKYMAPEQALGSKVVDRRADIFALGAVLFRMLAGHAPFEADNEVATLHKLASGAEPERMPDSVPPSIRDVVGKALQLLPDERYKTALEMHQALTEALMSLGISADASELAAFVETNLHERIARRRETIDLALKAAAERASASPLASPTPSSPLEVSPRSSMSASASIYTGGLAPAPATAIDLDLPTKMALPVHPTSPNLRWLWGAALLSGVIGATLIVLVAVQHRPTSPQLAAPPAPIEPPPVASNGPPEIITAPMITAPAKSIEKPPPTKPSAHPLTPQAPKPPPARGKPSPVKPGPTNTADFGY
jgi:serine/threonine-protein kinase